MQQPDANFKSVQEVFFPNEHHITKDGRTPCTISAHFHINATLSIRQERVEIAARHKVYHFKSELAMQRWIETGTWTLVPRICNLPKQTVITKSNNRTD